MKPSTEAAAWLEKNGERFALTGNCSLGRDQANQIVLDGPRVSRRHAIIHVQNLGEFWLIDLGSANGTLLNQRRIHQPVRLCDQDCIAIGEIELRFHEPGVSHIGDISDLQQQTVRQVDDVNCWLLLADIVDFSQLCRSVVTTRLAHLLGNWFAVCKQTIENHRGTINKYLGDGFLAYWRDNKDSENEIVSVIRALKALQQEGEPPFRFVIHTGTVAVGGLASMGEESLMGGEVNLVFRLEKLAGSIGERCVLSDKAARRLVSRITCRNVGDFVLKGFEGKHALLVADEIN